MKKTLSIVVIAILALLISATPILATTSFVVALSATTTKVEKGAETEVTISLKNFTANETGINSAKLTINYDKAVFETLASTAFTGLSGWGGIMFNPSTGELVIDNSSFMAENHDFLKIKFKAKADAALGNTVIGIKDFSASDALNDIVPAEQAITLTIKDAAVANNTNNTPATNNNTPANTNTATKNPSTGIEDYTVPAIFAIAILGLIGYVRYTKLDK